MGDKLPVAFSRIHSGVMAGEEKNCEPFYITLLAKVKFPFNVTMDEERGDRMNMIQREMKKYGVDGMGEWE